MIRLTSEIIRPLIGLIIWVMRRIIRLMIGRTTQLWSIVRYQGNDTSTVVTLSSPAMASHQGGS